LPIAPERSKLRAAKLAHRLKSTFAKNHLSDICTLKSAL